MKRKFILKFDIYEERLRVCMYKAESIRIEGLCEIDIDLHGNLNSHYVAMKLDDLYLKLDSEFDIGFKKNSRANIKHWVKKNIFKIYLRHDIPKKVQDGILKTIDYGTVIIVD